MRYGRNDTYFLDKGMSGTGIEISETAIELARTKFGLQTPICHGFVESRPFDNKEYDGILCIGLIYLLEVCGRQKLIHDCPIRGCIFTPPPQSKESLDHLGLLTLSK